MSDEFNLKSSSIYTAMYAKLYSALDIINKVKIARNGFNHGEFTAAVLRAIIIESDFDVERIGYKSLFENFHYIPEAFSVSNDVRPDVGIYQGQRLVCIFEEDSTKNDSFEKSITKACHYSRALCRLKSINLDSNQEGVCFVFPSAFDDTVMKVQMAVVQVSCQWDYQFCRFSYTGKAIPLNELEQQIQSVIKQQHSVEVTIRGDTKYLYKFSTQSSLTLGYFGYHYNFQYPSARSIVLNVDDGCNQYVMKFVDSKAFKILEKLKGKINHDSILHYFKHFDFDSNSNLSALMYEMLEPPLTAMEAKKCLKDFIASLHTTLQAVHEEMKFEHCDLRLENICFRLHQDSYTIVLIDIEFGVFTNVDDWKCTLFPMSESSCLYRNISNVKSVDYRQLGYMIVWVYRYGTEVVMQSGNKFEFKLNNHYHNLDKCGELAYERDEFVGKLITNGELFSFVFLI